MADDFNFLHKSGDKVTWGEEEVLVQGGMGLGIKQSGNIWFGHWRK